MEENPAGRRRRCVGWSRRNALRVRGGTRACRSAVLDNQSPTFGRKAPWSGSGWGLRLSPVEAGKGHLAQLSRGFCTRRSSRGGGTVVSRSRTV